MRSTQVVRRWSGPFFLTAAATMLVTAVGSLLAAVMLWSSGGILPTTSFEAGETYVVPSHEGGVVESLVIYAANPDAGTNQAGCRVVSDDGYERVTGLAYAADPVVVDGRTMTGVANTSHWQPGDRVTCTGRDAAAMAPFAVGAQGFPLEIRIGAVGFAVFAGGFALVLLVVGLVLRTRASSAPHPAVMGPGPDPGTHRPNPSTRLP